MYLTNNITIETACLNIIRNNIQKNNMNITSIMEKPKIPKEIVFDKILINTYNRCMGLMDLQKANRILSIDSILLFNSSDVNYVAINPEEYKYTSIPSFSQKEKEILNNFYGVNNYFFIYLFNWLLI